VLEFALGSEFSTGDPQPMASSPTKLLAPASESQKNVLLVVCILMMSVLCIGLVWQAQIISNQREDIKWLQELKIGS
jgi:hypothetical protein